MNELIKLNMDPLILLALQEDITSEDITTNAVIKAGVRAQVNLIAKEAGIIAGLAVYQRVFELLDGSATVEKFVSDGDTVKPGDLLAIVAADTRTLLSGERTALNYLQRMSGIATHTRKLVGYLSGTKTRLLDTRKTTPNMRIFEKYAVTVGGGYNHRYNLSDGILIKDNHINAAGGVKEAIAATKKVAPFVRKIEVEVENLEMLSEALEAGADIIMLDNMDTETMKAAIEIIAGRAITECSGNVTEARLKELSEIGVDFISCGALTHSSAILDLSMKNLRLL
ncbi:MAG: nicotinate-nucleotide diphosphorylase (carboxylating) [Candidatus Wallbacteria bacterium HGW-Wallbacteria-1]|uniref:Probable nicotinate-nucleotide pyrophosphorylase [carboxylating] n=1 Tax=Candidatus Wallbacteria bacterium HGW-Wallbacteria-1 TaxID=2013854 RepID=A0A2N1PHQ6_9BACT|nr:MAG: nicotinate-nucleotide diphosphorylase (carboxylating) [Candidatus Wallbacteria bacterium HGW-Wallbacteria-1]